jgi:DNA polymerase III sliding clamp (beta) subunit (PCNA family)
MRFDKQKDPAAVATKEGGRYAVNGVAIIKEGDGTFLAATDGRCLTLVRAFEEDGDDSASSGGRIYPAAAFVAARKAAKRKPEAQLTLNGAAFVVADGVRTEFARVDGVFPDVRDIVPKAVAVGILRLDAELLARIQRALGSTAVEIRVHAMAADGREVEPSVPLTIVPVHIGGGEEDGSRGYLMPVRGD